MVTVKNVNVAPRLACNCGSWLEHWKNNKGLYASICLVTGCSRTDILEGHVVKVNSTDQRHYIVPICGLHSATTGSFDVVDDSLAPAHRQLTCE